jgi:enoyl-CoA hydratase/carnithine racemase
MNAGASTDVLLEKRGQVAWITINRPDRYNALGYASYEAIGNAFKNVGFDSSISVVVLTGEVSRMCSDVWWGSMMPTMELARQSLLRLAGGEEMTEGASAFTEKRKPDFRRFRK